MWSIIAKYGPLLAKYASYIKYLPLVASLISLVRTAERDYKAAGSNEAKLAWASEQFGMLVNAFVEAGLLSAAKAAKLLENTTAFITTIVQMFNLMNGSVPPAPPVDPPVEPIGFPYGDLLDAPPLRTDPRLKSGDKLYKNPAADEWIVFGGFGREPKSWTLIWIVE